MPMSMGNTLKLPYKLQDLLNQIYTILKNHLILVTYIMYSCFKYITLEAKVMVYATLISLPVLD